jgi:hypothetical protein
VLTITKRNASPQTTEEIILALPSPSEILQLRGERSRIKAPNLSPGSHWGNTRIGEYSVTGSKQETIVSWITADGKSRQEIFQELISKEELEPLRLELGWMIANMLRVEAIRALQTIPGPNEAQEYWKFYKKEERRWRRWAVMKTEP